MQFCASKRCFTWGTSMHAFFSRSDDIIISVKSVQAKFLGLEELGAVLHQLSHDFPGT